MKLYSLTGGSLGTNCFIVGSDKGNAVVIDPGFDSTRILNYLHKKELTLQKILLTHCHYDHIIGVAGLIRQTGAALYIHAADAKAIGDRDLCLASMFEEDFEPLAADVLLQDGDTVELDELQFHVLHTPGHTPGCVCFLLDNIMFSGDTLFAGSVGRTDFAGGDFHAQHQSLLRLNELTVDYKVYPGHGESTTLSYEKATNIYIGKHDDEAFI